MDWGGFFLFNALCDAAHNIGKDSGEIPTPGTPEYDRLAKEGIVIIALLVIMAIIIFCLIF